MKKILGQVFCPYCKSSSVKEIGDNSGGAKKHYKCLDCKRKFKPNSFVKSNFPNWVIASILCCVFKGEKPQDIVKSLITEATNRRLNFSCQEKIPDEKTLYDIIEKCAKKLEKFNDLMIRLIGGLQCRKCFAMTHLPVNEGEEARASELTRHARRQTHGLWLTITGSMEYEELATFYMQGKPTRSLSLRLIAEPVPVPKVVRMSRPARKIPTVMRKPP